MSNCSSILIQASRKTFSSCIVVVIGTYEVQKTLNIFHIFFDANQTRDVEMEIGNGLKRGILKYYEKNMGSACPKFL